MYPAPEIFSKNLCGSKAIEVLCYSHERGGKDENCLGGTHTKSECDET
jgi:hypothetical protein